MDQPGEKTQIPISSLLICFLSRGSKTWRFKLCLVFLGTLVGAVMKSRNSSGKGNSTSV